MANIIIDPFTGVKHLPGSELCMMATLCGEIDNFEEESYSTVHSEEGLTTTGIPDCAGCIDAAKVCFESITQKELKKTLSWRESRQHGKA